MEEIVSKESKEKLLNKDSNSDLTYLPLGEELTTDLAYEISRSKNTRLIIFAGQHASGKTTIGSSIYQKFLDGPFKEYIFAGSHTLPAFELICHASRLSSGRETSKTERTKHLDKYMFLHLKVQNKNLIIPPQDILFMNVSGELFKEVRDSSKQCNRHKIFLRADHFVFLIDGDKLRDIFQRDTTVNDTFLLIRRLIDSNVLGKHSFVDILITKWDIVKSNIQDQPNLESYIEKIKIEKFENTFNRKVGQLRFSNIAARPDIKLGTGLDPCSGLYLFFKSWIENSPGTRLLNMKQTNQKNIVREIDHYRDKYFK